MTQHCVCSKCCRDPYSWDPYSVCRPGVHVRASVHIHRRMRSTGRCSHACCRAGWLLAGAFSLVRPVSGRALPGAAGLLVQRLVVGNVFQGRRGLAAGYSARLAVGLPVLFSALFAAVGYILPSPEALWAKVRLVVGEILEAVEAALAVDHRQQALLRDCGGPRALRRASGRVRRDMSRGLHCRQLLPDDEAADGRVHKHSASHSLLSTHDANPGNEFLDSIICAGRHGCGRVGQGRRRSA